MASYVLDTDTFSLLLAGDEPLSSRVLATPAADLATTVITVEESLSGWYTLIRQVRRPDQLEFAYGELIRAVVSFGRLRILNFTQSVATRFDALARAKLNVKKNDLRIAAIALEAGAPSSPATSGTSAASRTTPSRTGRPRRPVRPLPGHDRPPLAGPPPRG